jgi:hypothetical protein
VCYQPNIKIDSPSLALSTANAPISLFSPSSTSVSSPLFLLRPCSLLLDSLTSALFSYPPVLPSRPLSLESPLRTPPGDHPPYSDPDDPPCVRCSLTP